MTLAELGEHTGQDFRADEIAGGETHRASGLVRLARGRALESGGGRLHRLGMRHQRERRRRRREPVTRAREQARAERRLERVDMAAERGLGEAELARRGGEAAEAHHAQKRAVQIPGRRGIHTLLYAEQTPIANSRLAEQGLSRVPWNGRMDGFSAVYAASCGWKG